MKQYQLLPISEKTPASPQTLKEHLLETAIGEHEINILRDSFDKQKKDLEEVLDFPVVQEM